MNADGCVRVVMLWVPQNTRSSVYGERKQFAHRFVSTNLSPGRMMIDERKWGMQIVSHNLSFMGGQYGELYFDIYTLCKCVANINDL